jgi:methylated-DNA-[protein]-cysteine S-methyltransferase
MMNFMEKVYAACSKIPKGKVSTYGEIAAALGKPGASRAVGNALNKNRSSSVPCHRVVRSDGSVGGFAHGSSVKIRMLENEGIRIRNGKVEDLSKITKSF